MQSLLVILIVITGIILPTQVKGEREDYILLISSYNSNSSWAKTLEASFRQELKKNDCPYPVYSEYLNTDLFASPEIWIQSTRFILNNHRLPPPKMVILIADAAWMAYRYTRQDSWKNVDVLLVGVKKYSLDLSEYLHPTRLSAHNFQLTQDLCRSYNATGITEDIYIPQNIQLMQALRPDLQEIAVIGDCQFFGIYSTLLVKKYLQEYPSDLKFTFLDGRFLSTNTLYERLQHLSPNTGILLTGWMQDAEGYLYDHEKVHHNICQLAPTPVFSVTDWGNNNIDYIGGYYAESFDYGVLLSELALRVLGGVPAKAIPLQSNTQSLGVHINETLLEANHLNIGNCNTSRLYFYNRPPTFWTKHRTLLLLCGGSLGGGILIYLVIFTSLRFVFYRKKLDKTQSEIDTSMNNQEHLSAALRVFLEAKNEKESVEKILQRMLKELEADRAYIFEFDMQHNTSKNTYEICADTVPPQIEYLQHIPNEDIPWLYSQMQEDKLLITEDLRVTQKIKFEKERHLLLEQGIISMFVAPLHVNNQLWGYVGVDYVRQVRPCSQQDKIYLQTLAQILCIGIEHFRSEKRNTQSKRRVAELESLFSFASIQAHIGVAQWNVSTRQGFATDQWFINLGETTRDITQVIDTYRYMHPEDRTALLQFIDEAAQGQAHTFGRHVRIRQNNEWHWYKYHASLRDPHASGEQVELVFLSADIDNLKKIEANLIQAKAKAEESDRLKSAFIANMSHEIRTPLNAIVGFSNLLASEMDFGEEDKAEYTRIISVNNDLLLQLINDILDISKIEAGVMDFTENTVELNQFFQEIESVFQLKAKTGIEIKFIPEQAEEYAIKIDRIRLNQVISNFLNNALKFTRQGHIFFGYRLREKDIYFYVEDTGIGIPKDQQASVFRRFVKLNNFIQGTGLGLSICSTIIDKFNGKIGVESEPEKGSTFWFTIPRD